VDFCVIGEGSEPDSVSIVWATETPFVSRAVAEVAILGLNELLVPWKRRANGQSFTAALADLRDHALGRRMSYNNAITLQAARRRGIACTRVGGPLVRLGEGKFQQLLQSAITEHTGHAAISFSSDKRLTSQRLSELRLPVPRNTRVATLEEATATAERLGYPVVIKPARGSQGEGITAGVRDRTSLVEAWHRARALMADVIVEQFLEGQDFRLLVIGDEFVAAVTRRPPSIAGDGQRTIDNLIDELNRDPFRDNFRLKLIKKDEDLVQHLASLGYALTSVLEAGKTIALRTVANVAQGGYAADVTDEVHPDNREMAIRAARALGLDVAGIDFMTTDISRSFKESGGGIIEVNARPGLDLHTWPRYGKQRDVGGALIDYVYPNGARWRVPVCSLVGDARTAVIARDVDQFMRCAGRHVGLVIRDRAYVDGEAAPVDWGPTRAAARLLLRDPQIEVLVHTTSLRRLLARGLQVCVTDVAAIAAPAPGADLDAYCRGLEIVVRARARRIVIGADNSVAFSALSGIERERVVLVARDAGERVASHIAAGGSAFVLSSNDGQREIHVHEAGALAARIPFLSPRADPAAALTAPATGHRSRLVAIRLLAAAVAYGLGLSAEQIAHAISLAPAVRN
jgi:cyanophycin synthetase